MSRYLLFSCVCKNCESDFKVLTDPEDYCNNRLLFSKNTYQGAIIACNDPAFHEVYELVKKHIKPTDSKVMDSTGIFNAVFGEICDPAPDGSKYDMSGKIWCPKCQSNNISYGPTDPPEFKEIDLPYALHRTWDYFSFDEKDAFVKSLVDLYKG